MDKEEIKTKLNKNKKELLANILFCGIIGGIAGVILRNILSSYLLSMTITTLCAEGLGLTVNVSLIKENKHLKAIIKQEQEENENSVEKLETPNLEEEKVQEKYQEKKDFVIQEPISQMTLYGYRGLFSPFFPIYLDLEKTKEWHEINIYMQYLHSITFIGNHAGKRNVIRICDYKNIADIKEYFVTKAEDGYIILNEEKSVKSEDYIWEHYANKGSIIGINIKKMYEEFQKRGIILEEEICNKVETEQPNEEMILMLSKTPKKK